MNKYSSWAKRLLILFWASEILINYGLQVYLAITGKSDDPMLYQPLGNVTLFVGTVCALYFLPITFAARHFAKKSGNKTLTVIATLHVAFFCIFLFALTMAILIGLFSGDGIVSYGAVCVPGDGVALHITGDGLREP